MKARIYRGHRVLGALSAALCGGCLTACGAAGDEDVMSVGEKLSGAIFTTTKYGTVVNENTHYESKKEVYLDGGPGPNAPKSAAALPEGKYFFQVTDPSGKILLSTDPLYCRIFHVNAKGVIDGVFGVDGCAHKTSKDVDGGLTVQLWPFRDTPNPGGVYKVWVTPVDGHKKKNGKFEFKNKDSKTDNFKVVEKLSKVRVVKFNDKNVNGKWDYGEEEVTGWPIKVTDPYYEHEEYYTPFMTELKRGKWEFEEKTPKGTKQTVAIVDDYVKSKFPHAYPKVELWVDDKEEKHKIVYGNVGLGKIRACKFHDKNRNGKVDRYEPPVPYWPIKLEGRNVLGYEVKEFKKTGKDGCARFDHLLPGKYLVKEGKKHGWYPTGPDEVWVHVKSVVDGSKIEGSYHRVIFTNKKKHLY